MREEAQGALWIDLWADVSQLTLELMVLDVLWVQPLVTVLYEVDKLSKG